MMLANRSPKELFVNQLVKKQLPVFHRPQYRAITTENAHVGRLVSKGYSKQHFSQYQLNSLKMVQKLFTNHPVYYVEGSSATFSIQDALAICRSLNIACSNLAEYEHFDFVKNNQYILLMGNATHKIFDKFHLKNYTSIPLKYNKFIGIDPLTQQNRYVCKTFFCDYVVVDRALINPLSIKLMEDADRAAFHSAALNFEMIARTRLGKPTDVPLDNE